ncbi:TonB-linked SusC/RagA family outer membrane protein [Chitinophaga skermanii]|uniref:TonB-linked SusC/RagA family outer membrane protein n=1 Tax=Chitinophaga skermanii TaxID=331697 RepID=A0A327QCS0_9BACT|nr:TonB-dependent receptor [Chitinophaga skermanii]RAJ02280.1 TonB-linked SusC/RagA family outer membrane protein [Chitinophaga skermanii]
MQKTTWLKPILHWLLFFLCFVVTPMSLMAQSNTVVLSGTVTNEKGEYLPGVTVMVQVEGKKFGAATGGDGKYSIGKLPANATAQIIFTFLGYETKTVEGFPIKNENVTLSTQLKENDKHLSELVVVGYGTQKKVNLTGAVSQLDSKTIGTRSVANITQAIQGAVPNLNVTFGDGSPGKGGNINIRGNTSINGGSPLVLIDGVPGDINLVNPRDVETISVLKDAASSAIYGARGAFGVILVTTKRAKKGKATVNYSNNFSYATSTVSTDFITSGYRSAKLNDEAFLRATGNTYTRYTDKDYEELLKRETDKSLPSVVKDVRNNKEMYIYYGNTDWWHEMFRDVQPSMEHALTFSGSTEKVDYMLSGRWYEKKGMMRINQDKFNAYNMRAKINANVTPWLTLSSNTQFSANNYTYPGWGVNDNFVSITVHALPSYVPRNPDGTATYRTELNNYTIGDGVYADLLYGKSKGGTKNFDFSNTFGATIKATKDFNIIGNYTFDLNPYSSFSRRVESPWSVFPGVISYVGYDQYNEEANMDQYHIVNLYGEYTKSLAKHNFKAMVGYNQELKRYKQTKGMRKNLLSQDLNDFDLGSGDQTIGGRQSEWALLGFFYRVNYDYAGKYLLELNGRYDGSSRFPKGNKYGFFPSVSGAWRVSEERFFEPVKNTVNDLKLRASYGTLGNQQVSTDIRANYPYIPLMDRGTSNYIVNGAKTEYLTVPAPTTQNLTWEKSTSTNLGVDVALFKSRLTGSFDWYVRNTTDMLTKSKTLPAVYGAAEPKQNAADLQTKGFELALAWADQKQVGGKPFNYSIGVAVGDYKSRITRFDNPSGTLSDYYVGQELGEIWGYSVDGYFKTDKEAADYQAMMKDLSSVHAQIFSAPGEWGKLLAGDMKFVDLNGDLNISKGKNTLADHGDLRVIGNKQPRYSYGINGSASWNGFDFYVLFQGIGKQNWYPGANADKFWGPYSRPYYSFLPQDFESKVWSEQNPDAYFPRLRGYVALNAKGELTEVNDKYLQNLAYLRLKSLTLGYSLPATWMKRVKMERARFYFSGENLLTFTKFDTKYIDPEMAAAEANGRVYPVSKTFSFGLDITF